MPFDTPYPRRFSSSNIRLFAPSEPGLYGLSNATEWIYIGTTENIRDTLLSHLAGERTAILVREPTGFVFEVCSGEQRRERQNRLVMEYEPIHNRYLPGN